jgi:hypothetical protein
MVPFHNARASVRSDETDVWVDEYKNINGVAVFTGKRLFSGQRVLDSSITSGELISKHAFAPLGQVFPVHPLLLKIILLKGLVSRQEALARHPIYPRLFNLQPN